MTRFEPPSRKEYIRDQKEHHGRRIFGVFPAQYPKEILWAWNILPVEIWDPPGNAAAANAHLQPYICSVVRAGLELVLQGKWEDLDGFLFPHTCDSIQNLASIVNDCLGINKPCYFFYHPKAPYHASSRAYCLDQLRDFASVLEDRWGPVNMGELEKRVSQGEEVRALIKEVYDSRAAGKLNATNEEFYRVIRQGEFLHPDDYIPLLKEFLKAAKGEAGSSLGLILSGVLPNPPETLKLLDTLNVRVTEDDLLNCGRRLLVPPVAEVDPFEALADAYFLLPPCTTRNSPIQERLEHLLMKANRSGAKGIVFWMIKFCEPEFFDLPQLVEGLKREGLATLVLESELHQGLSGQMRTRIEAFVEMIR